MISSKNEICQKSIPNIQYIVLVNSKKEGTRLRAQAESLHDFTVPNSRIKLKTIAYPSLVDGKTKLHWGNCKHGSKACWICYAFLN